MNKLPRIGPRKFSASEAQEIQRLHHPDIDTWQKATIAKPVGGKYVKYAVGEAVLVKRSGPRKRTFTITRARWRGSMVPLAHSCILVPASHLSFQ